jgi:hypothetical protein
MAHRTRAIAPDTARRAVLAIALAALLLPGAPAAPVQAEHAPDHESIARLQVVLTRIHVEDDEDWFGEGEIEGEVHLERCNHAVEKCTAVGSRYLVLDFNADSGDTRTFDRVLPGLEANGFPVYPGDWFTIAMELVEQDELGNHTVVLRQYGEDMGDVNFVFSEADNWRLGRPLIAWSSNSDYWVEFEVRPAPVPDLSPVGIKTLKLPGTTDDTVCVGVVNRELPPAGSFKVTLRVNDAVPAGGVMEAGGLPGGQAGELCVETTLPATAELVATVDEERAVVEYSEANNRLAQPYTAPQGAAASGPAAAPASGPMQADLAALGIRVKSAESGGGNDCDPGRNDITVVVKNAGQAAADGFTVRLIVDGEGDEAKEKSVAGLEAGKELEVQFDDVRLRQGMRELKTAVDAKKAVVESDEDNNEIKLSVNCRDD